VNIKALFYYFFPLLVLTGITFSCRKESTRWETDWVFPFISDTLDLSNLHNDSTLNNYNSINYLVDLKRDVLDVSLSEFLIIPDTTIAQSFSPTIGIGSVPAGFTFYNEVEAHELSIPDVELKRITVSEGLIELKVFNPIATGAYYTIEMPGVVKNGVTLEQTFFIPAGTTDQPSVAFDQIVLDGYEIDLRGEDIEGTVNVSGYNILQTSLSIMSDPDGVAVPITTSDIFEVEAKFIDVSIGYAQGYFGEQVFSDTTSFKVPLLSQITAGTLSLEDVPIDITVSNGTKIPFSTNISLLKNTNYVPETVHLSSSLIGAPQLISPASGFWSSLTPSSQMISFDNSNSNMTAYIENLGYTHELGFEVRMNPLGNITGSYNEVFPNSRLKLSLSSQFPLSVGLNGLTIEDTLSLNLSSKVVQDLIVAEEVSLYISAVNAFPISGMLHLFFLDELGSVIHEITNINEIGSSMNGSLDPIENLLKNETSIEIVLNSSIIYDLDRIDQVILKAEFNTADGFTPQTIPSNAFLGFSSYFKVKTRNTIE
jgi:hypothetical protein